jgi:hypothetical protein
MHKPTMIKLDFCGTITNLPTSKDSESDYPIMTYIRKPPRLTCKDSITLALRSLVMTPYQSSSSRSEVETIERGCGRNTELQASDGARTWGVAGVNIMVGGGGLGMGRDLHADERIR